MMPVGVYGAETDKEAQRISSSMKINFAQLRTGQIGKLAYPVDNIVSVLTASLLAGVEQNIAVSVIGNPAVVSHQLEQIISRHQPDEVLVSAVIHDPVTRKRSFEIVARALQEIGAKELA